VQSNCSKKEAWFGDGGREVKRRGLEVETLQLVLSSIMGNSYTQNNRRYDWNGRTNIERYLDLDSTSTEAGSYDM